jgi:hypothetical protein
MLWPATISLIDRRRHALAPVQHGAAKIDREAIGQAAVGTK